MGAVVGVEGALVIAEVGGPAVVPGGVVAAGGPLAQASEITPIATITLIPNVRLAGSMLISFEGAVRSRHGAIPDRPCGMVTPLGVARQ